VVGTRLRDDATHFIRAITDPTKDSRKRSGRGLRRESDAIADRPGIDFGEYRVEIHGPTPRNSESATVSRQTTCVCLFVNHSRSVREDPDQS
jgi:hypothetical protein